MRYSLVLIEAVMFCRRVEVPNGDFVRFYSFLEYTLKNLFFRELNPLSAIPRRDSANADSEYPYI